MDFNCQKLIGRDIESDYEPLKQAGGYDHPWLLSGREEQAELYDEPSGSKYDGICFETQYEPDGVNHEGLNSAELTAGSTYNERTVFKLEVL